MSTAPVQQFPRHRVGLDINVPKRVEAGEPVRLQLVWRNLTTSDQVVPGKLLINGETVWQMEEIEVPSVERVTKTFTWSAPRSGRFELCLKTGDVRTCTDVTATEARFTVNEALEETGTDVTAPEGVRTPVGFIPIGEANFSDAVLVATGVFGGIGLMALTTWE